MSTNMATDIVCTGIARRLAETVGANRYRMWFDHGARLSYEEPKRELQVTVPNRFVADWIGRHFEEAIKSAATEEIGMAVEVAIQVDPLGFSGEAMRLQSAAAALEAAPAAVAEKPRPVRASEGPRQDTGRTLRYRLEEFVIGPCNELAYATACRLVDQEDLAGVSPLFIHGGVGLGKTHLLQGICRRMLDKNPKARVLYTTGEQFTNEFLTAVRGGKIDAFRARIRKLDLLAVDDVHFIANKTATQQEFLHSFNAIELAGARVVLASDQHPKMIAQFSQALVSRCVRGMVVEVRTPDTSTRMRIVQALAQRRGLSMMESVVSVIAGKCPGSVRELEGTLTRLHALATLMAPTAGSGPGTIGHALVNQAFAQDMQTDRTRPIRVETIVRTVAERLGMDPQRIMRGDRHRLIVLARSLVIHLTRQMTPLSFPEIAQALGRASHSSIIAAEQRLHKQLEQQETVVFVNSQTGVPESVPLRDLLEEIRHALKRA